jgi:YesN/AraC family two-component response regulator
MKKIMLVDDAEISNFIMKKLISNTAVPCEVIDFSDPQKAINSVADVNPDIIFLDVNMPIIDGWRFLQIMKERNLSHPVFILTSSTSEFDRQRSLEFSNVKNFLVKPLTARFVLEIVKQVLEPAEA